MPSEESVRSGESVLLHFDPASPFTLLGIWRSDPGLDPPWRPFYPDASPAEAAALESLRSHAVPGRSWAELVAIKCGQTPYSIWWETATIEAGTSDVEAFSMLAAAAAAGAESTQSTGESLRVDDLVLTPVSLAGLAKRLGEASTAGERLAVLAGGPTEPFVAKGRLSSHFEWFADSDRLVVVCPDPDAAERDAQLALAHGLAWRGERDLWLVLPAERVESGRSRVAFLEVPVTVFSWSGDDVTACPPLPRWEVEARFEQSPLRGTALHDLGETALWVNPLVSWADQAPGLVPAHRQSYRAWHCEGRQVLKLRRAGSSVEVTAGVAYGDPGPDQEAPVELEVSGPLGPADSLRAIAAAAAAAADRLDGIDTDHAEHRLQALLHAQPNLLGLKSLRREVPALRADGSSGFIDFVGIDSYRRIHVIETKLGPDPMLALQALDYWIWATANLAAVADHYFDEPAPTGVVIDIVVANKPGRTQVFGPYTAAQLEAFAGSASWRIRCTDRWDGLTSPPLRAHPTREVPPDVRRKDPHPRWAVRLQRHLRAHAEQQGWNVDARSRWKPADAGLTQAASEIHADLAARDLLHRAASHVRSSQAFALNLFAGLPPIAWVMLHEAIGLDVAAVFTPTFEAEDRDDLLAESTPKSPHTTQVDLVVRSELVDGTRHLLLIEVKLSEDDFGDCSAYRSPKNDTRHVCDQPHPFGGDPAACFQLRNHDNGPRRRYLDVLGPMIEHPAGAGCWFRDGANQPMRNVALAAAMVEADQADRATFVLCAPFAHVQIWRRWFEAKDRLTGHPTVRLAELPADWVVSQHGEGLAADLAARYLLERLIQPPGR